MVGEKVESFICSSLYRYSWRCRCHLRGHSFGILFLHSSTYLTYSYNHAAFFPRLNKYQYTYYHFTFTLLWLNVMCIKGQIKQRVDSRCINFPTYIGVKNPPPPPFPKRGIMTPLPETRFTMNWHMHTKFEQNWSNGLVSIALRTHGQTYDTFRKNEIQC